ncbi:ABC transporter permease [Agathobaculum sp.]|uniref:ABC transporter permease n=1 Tax=Agathobaculum sp. TaxID=2048138 RepID=UPI002A8217CE|nr:ABC transporter permease [Agathobaculum sp.]MDY3618222.1 ABC transporter permease [Agathobaculum sp.]
MTNENKITVKDVVSKLGTLIALFILCVILAFATPNFLKQSNLMAVLKQTTSNALICVGMLMCLITAGIDLSVGANAITVGCVMGMMLKHGITNPVLLLAAGLGFGTLIGWINGTLLTRLHLPHPFVSTLGMKNVLCGFALLIVDSKMVSGFPDGVTWLGSATLPKSVPVIGGFPICFLVVILIYVVMHIFLTHTSLGRAIYCVGGNPDAARMSGINSANVLTFCYTLSGFMCAVAGIVLVGRTGVANGANALQPYDTDAIASCIIGGASFMGGKGTMVGTMIGALTIAILRNGLTLLNAQSDIQYIVIGFVIIFAVLIDVVRAQMEARARRLAAK